MPIALFLLYGPPVPHHRKLTTDIPDTPVTWHYLPVIHHKQQDSRHNLTLTDHDGSVIRTTVTSPEAAELLEPYLHLYELEKRAPWTHSPAFVPVEPTADGWQFSTAGALYDREAATGSGTAENPRSDPYRRLSFQ